MDLSNGRPDIGLVIFTKNEEKTIDRLIDEVYNWIDKKSIFVIDGHSIDTTALIVQRKGIALFFDPQKGKGSAIQLALNTIEKDILIFMDSDGSHRPEEIPLFVEAFLRDKDVDLVIGSRFKGRSDELHGSFHEIIRYIGNIVSTFIVNLIWKTSLSDVQSGFRAVKRDAIRELSLSENGFAIEQEMVIRCLKNKKKIVEIPSWELKRKYSKSHVSLPKMFLSCVFSFIKMLFYEKEI